MLYGYYIVVAYILRTISPPLAQMASQEAALTGSFRAAHQVGPAGLVQSGAGVD